MILLLLSLPNIAYADHNSEIKIMTLNLHGGLDENGQNNLTRVLQFFEAEKPAIIALQELKREQLKIFRAAGYHVVSGMNHNLFSYGFGNAILTRYKIIYHRHHYLPSNLEQRGLDEVAVDVNGTAFILLNTHLGLGKAERQQQFDEIQRIIAYLHGPVIICGDFNTSVSDSLFDEFKGNFDEIGQDIPIGGSFPARNPQKRLDQLWYDRNWQPIKAQTLPWRGSDHLPVAVELVLNTPSAIPILPEEIPEVTADNNPLLPNIGQSFPKVSLAITPKANKNKFSGSLNVPVTDGIRISGEYDNSGFTSVLYYHMATIDLKDYMSKWKIRGKGEWITSVMAGPEDEPWLSWEQYYRWSDGTGTKIIISNQENEITCRIEQISLVSRQVGWSIGLDREEKISLGIRFTPDQKNMFEIKWYPDDPDHKWKIEWSYQ